MTLMNTNESMRYSLSSYHALKKHSNSTSGLYKPKFHLLHHVTTRYLAHAFWYRKNSYVLSRMLYSTSRHSTSWRAQQARHIRHH